MAREASNRAVTRLMAKAATYDHAAELLLADLNRVLPE